jgi:AAA domain
MYGKPGDGKSVLAEDLALHVAAGRTWHGHKVKQGAVVFIALERRKLVERRAIAFREKHGLTDLPFAIVGGVHDFRNAGTVASICKTVKAVEAATLQAVVLVVIDTLSRALCGGDENSPKDMGGLVAATGRIQEQTSSHVLWLHHVPLDAGDRMRGHGALLGAVDTTIHVAKATDGVRTATVIKANDSDEGEAISFTLESVPTGHDQDGNITTAPVVVPVENATRRKVAKPIRLSKAAQTALRALNEAISERGEIPPASNHIPANVQVTTIGTWREHAYRRGITTGEDRAKQQAFKRASEQLVGIQAVAIWDDFVWPVR